MYMIVGSYKGEAEVVDHADSYSEAEELLGEYAMAFGHDWELTIVADE